MGSGPRLRHGRLTCQAHVTENLKDSEVQVDFEEDDAGLLLSLSPPIWRRFCRLRPVLAAELEEAAGAEEGLDGLEALLEAGAEASTRPRSWSMTSEALLILWETAKL